MDRRQPAAPIVGKATLVALTAYRATAGLAAGAGLGLVRNSNRTSDRDTDPYGTVEEQASRRFDERDLAKVRGCSRRLV